MRRVIRFPTASITAAMRTASSKSRGTAVVLAGNNYENLELHYPRLRLLEAGYDVKVVGPKKDTYKSKEGYPAVADAAVSDVDPKTVNVVVIPGGWAPDSLRMDKKVVQWVSQVHDNDAVVAIICHGGQLAISAKIVKGKKCTCYEAIKDDMINAGAQHSDERVVVDGKMVTAQTPDDLPSFMKEVLRVLESKK
jgi:protease I